MFLSSEEALRQNYPELCKQLNMDWDDLDTPLASSPIVPMKGHENEVKIIEELQERATFTPDWEELKWQTYVPLFVYNDLKTKQRSNIKLAGSKYLGEGMTAHDLYVMKQPIWPVVFDTKWQSINAHIKGEVYAVHPDIILDIDRYLSNQRNFTRVKRHINLRDQYMPLKGIKRANPTIQCFMYIGNPDFWSIDKIPTCVRYGIAGNKKKFFCY